MYKSTALPLSYPGITLTKYLNLAIMYSMISPILYALASVIIVSCIPLIAGAIVFSHKKISNAVFILISVSIGALFGDVFIHLIPELFKQSSSALNSLYIIIGILFFFAFEKFFHWHHEHHMHTAECHERILPVGYMSLASDGIHNFIDGVIIGISYLVSLPVGIATTVAVILHEIPHEIGNIGILLHAGFSKKRAFLFNFYSGLLAIGGAIAALAISEQIQGVIPFILAFTAGSFIYIAGSDLLPELHKTTDPRHTTLQFFGIACGVGLMLLLLVLE